MANPHPIAVIGGGAAGTLAAAWLASQSRPVTLFAPGPGASALFGGAVDLVGDMDRQSGRGHKVNRNVRTNLLRQLNRSLDNPYRKLALVEGQPHEEKLMERLDEALNFFRSQMAFVGYGLEGQALMRQKGYLTSLGIVKEASLLHAPHARASVDDLQGAHALIVGLARAADGDAGEVARRMTDFCSARLPKLARLETAEIDLAPHERTQNLSLFTLAQRLETGEGAQRLLAEMARVASGKKYTHIFMPPAIGLTSHEYHLTKISEMLEGAAVTEMLGAPGWVTGWRLADAFTKLWEFHDIKPVLQPVVGFESEARRISALKTAEGAYPVSAVILAAGKFLAGGITRGREWSEPIFDLPVFLHDLPARGWTNLELVAGSVTARQPLFELGLRVDDRFRPVETTNRARWENLYAAGSTLTGYDYAVDQCGLGLAVATGCRAAKLALG